ncbi:MAG: MoaD/ThiS family protein [Acidimicrobiia bacterium]|nr:MoaD/ThiS family protein [Acidimicrobiia bacterium]MYC57619.1 MoaD/ThiS family protein [Acidimicrobiia bacterium]MYG94909.1 MoaD/ThiS family protein [Acidimicrobiia bacterium]MYI31250.1 MoaD/ThiS family protein [Acidimicrobiia bacterium]
MSVTVRIPTTLRPLASGASEVVVTAGTVQEVIAALDAVHPGFQNRLIDESGKLHHYVNVFVDDEDARFTEGLATAVLDGQVMAIVPAVAGG